MIDDEWAEDEEICYNCEHMNYFDDGVALMEICTKNDKFVLSTDYCDDFKNRWKK